MIKNPYRREYLIKKLFGRTAEQRKAKRAELKKLAIQNKEEVDNRLMAEELELTEQEKTRSSKRRDFAAKRAKLGFKDSKTEVDDPVLDQLEFDESKY